MNKQQRRPVTASDRVLAQKTGLDVPARERVDESRRQIRCT